MKNWMTLLLSTAVPFWMRAQFSGSGETFFPSALMAGSRFQPFTLGATVNPAALAVLTQNKLALYSEKRYGMPELSSINAVLALLSPSGNFGCSFRTYGFGSFRDTRTGIGYGRSLGTKADIGLQINYRSQRIGNGYGTASAFTADAGLLLHLSEKLQTGLYGRNIYRVRSGRNREEKIAGMYGFSIGYDVSENFFAGMLIEQEEGMPVQLNPGIQYRFLPRVWARAGIALASGSGWMGLGLGWKGLRLEVLAGYHQQLGFSPGLLLEFIFPGKNE